MCMLRVARREAAHRLSLGPCRPLLLLPVPAAAVPVVVAVAAAELRVLPPEAREAALVAVLLPPLLPANRSRP